MSTKRILRIGLVVAALHLIVLGFVFYKPPLNYFALICLSTVTVWSAVFALFGRQRRAGMIAGWLIQIVIQQVAYHSWLSGETGFGWPLAQFLALQYIIVLRLAPPPDNAVNEPGEELPK